MNYTIEGKTFKTNVEGLWFICEMRDDLDATANDYDCYTKKQLEAYENDEWDYAGISARLSFNGIDFPWSAIGGVEYGWLPITDENDNLLQERYVNPLYDPYIIGGLFSECVNGLMDAIASLSGLDASGVELVDAPKVDA